MIGMGIGTLMLIMLILISNWNCWVALSLWVKIAVLLV